MPLDPDAPVSCGTGMSFDPPDNSEWMPIESCDVDTKGYPFKHAMIDIETMSTHPSNALVLSCAVLPFAPEYRERLTIGVPRHWRFLLLPQLIAGRKVDESTQKFWASQPKEAQARLDAGKLVSIADFHAELKDALEGIEALWAWGVVFDIGNLTTLIRDAGLTEPWHYRAPACARAFTAHTAQTRHRDISEHGFVAEIIPHDPVGDCIRQAHSVWEHWGSPEPLAHHSV